MQIPKPNLVLNKIPVTVVATWLRHI